MNALITRARATLLSPHDMAEPAWPDERADRAATSGWLIIAIFFGLLGTWAAFAPPNGAVVAQAVVKIDGNRKSVQHLEGGIVRELKVKEGDKVATGSVLLILDDAQARSEFEVLDKLHLTLALTETRLRLEQHGGTALALPDALKSRKEEPAVIAAWHDQINQLDARRREWLGQAEIVKQRIAQLQSQIAGSEAQAKGLKSQHDLMSQELASLQPLLKEGIVTRTRLLQLERSIAALDGQIGEATASTSRAQEGIAEQHQLDAQATNQRATAIAQELRDVQMRLAEVTPKLSNARAVHERTLVRAPYAGRVVDLNVFAVGAVIGRGEKLMDIVPEDQSLIVEAKIAVEDIAEVAPRATAEVRLTGYKQQTTPALRGHVLHVSADRLTDNRTGSPYYVCNIQIEESELEALPQVKLYPGMPASVMLPTTSRTALQYLISPLRSSFDKAFRER